MSEQTLATKKVSATIGAFIALMHAGKLLLTRRAQTSSIIPGQSFYGNWELPGGAVEEGDEGAKGYNGVPRAALRKFKEKTGVNLEDIDPEEPSWVAIPSVYPFLFKGPAGYDLALVLADHATHKEFETLQGENFKWVDLAELNQLADDFKSETAAKEEGLPFAQGLLSGTGKRQHCMALCAFADIDEDEGQAESAQACLDEIIEAWQ